MRRPARRPTADPGPPAGPSPSEPVRAGVAADLAAAGWAVRRGFLGAETIAALARDGRELWELGAFRRAGVGSGEVRGEVRGDHVLWLEPALLTPSLRLYLDEMERLRLAVNEALFLGLFGFEAHLAVYPPGAFYRRHLDQHRATRHRVVSVILYLNDGWSPDDGGELRLETNASGGTLDVLPEADTLVCFLSGEIYHQVLPARRERWSLTGWFRAR